MGLICAQVNILGKGRLATIAYQQLTRVKGTNVTR